MTKNQAMPEFDLNGATERLHHAIDQNYSVAERISILFSGKPNIKVDDARKCLNFLPEAVSLTNGLPEDFKVIQVYLAFGRLSAGIERLEQALNDHKLDQETNEKIADFISRLKSHTVNQDKPAFQKATVEEADAMLERIRAKKCDSSEVSYQILKKENHESKD